MLISNYILQGPTLDHISTLFTYSNLYLQSNGVTADYVFYIGGIAPLKKPPLQSMERVLELGPIFVLGKEFLPINWLFIGGRILQFIFARQSGSAFSLLIGYFPTSVFFFFSFMARLVGNEAETLGRWNVPGYATTPTIHEFNTTGISGFSKK